MLFQRIIPDVETRSSSTCYMLQLFLEQSSAIQVECGEQGCKFDCRVNSDVPDSRKLRVLARKRPLRFIGLTLLYRAQV